MDRPDTTLGLGYRHWNRNDMGVILGHYGVQFSAGESKTGMIILLNELATQRGLTRDDRLAIINAHKAGERLPSRRPIIRASDPQSARTRHAVPSAPISEPNVSSDNSGDSDADTSDSEGVQELQTLSDEERDLREYTATMSMPRSSGRRRTVRSRLGVAKAVTRALPRRRFTGRRPNNISLQASSRRSTLAATTRAISTTRPRTQLLALQVFESVECLICYELFEPARHLMRQPTASCVHEVNICKPCLSVSISSQLDSKMWTRISCPAPMCGEILQYDDIQEFADPQIFARCARLVHQIFHAR